MFFIVRVFVATKNCNGLRPLHVKIGTPWFLDIIGLAKHLFKLLRPLHVTVIIDFDKIDFG